MIGEPKLSSFKIGRPKLQKVENRGTKTAIKPKIYTVYKEQEEREFLREAETIRKIIKD
jgi:hypothetical protein